MEDAADMSLEKLQASLFELAELWGAKQRIGTDRGLRLELDEPVGVCLISPGTQSQDTSAYKTTGVVCLV